LADCRSAGVSTERPLDNAGRPSRCELLLRIAALPFIAAHNSSVPDPLPTLVMPESET
jgi:hypothetical protein